ncbi:hypothetical protein [Frankia sp. CiP1_Cm_nod1]|uniref:hypothetical protein n=1 Tax=Frankia sp. CiP1_Cm_nod1 TaxID=2897160 RepID=UPI002024B4E3
MALSRAAARLYAEIGPTWSNCGPLQNCLKIRGDTQFAAVVEELVTAGLAVLEGRRIRRADAGDGNARLQPEMSADAHQIFDRLPPDGSAIGGLQLRGLVRLTNDRYRAAVEELKAAGLVRPGRGRGGTLARADDALQSPDAEVPATSLDDARLTPAGPGQLVHRESELYQPFVDWYRSDLDTRTLTFGHVRETATARGRARASGQWSRPDVAAVEVWSSPLLPDVELTISSFEIKRASEANRLESLYEAAAHGRWAHYPSLVVETASPEAELALREDIWPELDRLKLGLYTMYNLGDGTFQIEKHLFPPRQTPELGYLDELLEHFFSEDKALREKYQQAIGR